MLQCFLKKTFLACGYEDEDIVSQIEFTITREDASNKYASVVWRSALMDEYNVTSIQRRFYIIIGRGTLMEKYNV